MLKLRFDFVAIGLVAAYAILVSLDGFSKEDVSSVLFMFGFAALIKLFTGIEDIQGAIVWFRQRRGDVLRLFFGIAAISVMVLWRYLSGETSLVRALQTIFSAVFFFTTCMVLGLWLMDRIKRRFNRSKLGNSDDYRDDV
jgi:hypothetical protein